MPEGKASSYLTYQLTVSTEDLKGIAKEIFSSKRRSQASITGTRIELHPYYLFDYLAVPPKKEEKKEEAEAEGDQGEFSGSMSLDALTNELDESITELVEGIKTQQVSELKKATSLEVSQLKPKTAIQEAEKIILLKLSRQLGVAREDMVITNLKLAFIPFYLVQASFDDEEAMLKIDALQGNVFEGEESIPFKEKTSNELFGEAMADLASPGKLGSHLLHLIKWLFKSIVSLVKYFFSSQKRMLMLLLLLVALLVFLYTTGFIK